jgi:hypothetical protein
MTEESLGMHIALRCRASSTTTKSYSHFTRLVGKWHTRSTKEKRFVTIGQVPGSEEVYRQLELEDIGIAPYRLPREPAASHENGCLLRTPATYRRLQDFVTCSKKYPGYSAVGCFTIPNSLATSTPYASKSTRLRTGVKNLRWRSVYMPYIR